MDVSWSSVHQPKGSLHRRRLRARARSSSGCSIRMTAVYFGRHGEQFINKGAWRGEPSPPSSSSS